MIILYDKTETSFKSLGLGVLNDTISCVVTEQLNGSFELEMEYPLTGQHYKSIELENFIFVKPNMYDNKQAFRIYSISKPFNGIVTINAEHISYDMNGYTIPPFIAENLQEALDIISTTSVVPNQFRFYTDKEINSKMISPTPSSMRGLIAGREGSLLDLYKGEFIFDMYDVRLVNKRGEDRGVSIKYGKNMLDIEQDITSEKLFTGIFPFYHTTKNETVVEKIMIYEEVYVVHGSNPRYSNWLSKYPSDDFLNGGDPLIPIGDKVPVQIKTPGDYLDAIFWYIKSTINNGNLILAEIRDSEEFTIHWLKTLENVNIQPEEFKIYNIRTAGDYEGMKVVWNQLKGKYEEYFGEGFWYIPDVLPPPKFPKEIKTDDNQIEVYKDLRSITDNPNIVNGVLYVEGKKDSTHQKILTLDITDKFAEEPTQEHLLAKAEDYIANNKLDEIKEEITVSFIKLSDSVEYEHYKDLEKVKLGDTVHISYERLNIETTKTVIETEYNVLTNTYNEIELGTKKSSLGDTVIIAGSNISELTNDANYTDKIVVGRLLAQYITADLIEAKSAEFIEAAIESLSVRKMDVTGLIEASAAAINSLVAQSLTAENAEIKEALEAGQIKVKGKITATSGDIGGCYIEDGKLHITTQISIGQDQLGQVVFRVDENGHLFAKSVFINGGSIEIGNVDAPWSYNFRVDPEGNLFAKNAEIEGNVRINTGSIIIGDVDAGGNLVDGFNVDSDGSLTVNKISLTEKNVQIEEGTLYAEDAEISGVFKTLDMYVDRDITFYNENVKLGWIVVDDRVTHQRNIKFRIEETVLDPISGTIGYQVILETVEHNSNFPSSSIDATKYDHNFRVNARYGYMDYNGQVQMGSSVDFVQFSKGSTKGSSRYGFIDGERNIIPSSIRLSISPASRIETHVTGSDNNALGLDADLIPRTGRLYNLGNDKLPWNDIFVYNDPVVTSDRNSKKDISYDNDGIDDLFDLLKPASYKLNNGKSNRTHYGLIAQDVRDSLKLLNIDPVNFAGYIRAKKQEYSFTDESEIGEDDFIYGLRYGEFISLIIKQVQKLKQENKDILNRLKVIEEKMGS